MNVVNKILDKVNFKVASDSAEGENETLGEHRESENRKVAIMN